MMKKKVLIIVGSARKEGNTKLIANFILNKIPNAEMMDLNDYNFSGYDYDHKNIDDDFLGMAEHMLTFEKIVLCTPVYWYAMSSILKRFLDRWSDLVTIRKEKGRGMAGKYLMAVCCSSDHEKHDGFFMPFEKTAGYLDMIYGGHVHTWIEEGIISDTLKPQLLEFCEKINS